jgi:hypothetical protein
VSDIDFQPNLALGLSFKAQVGYYLKLLTALEQDVLRLITEKVNTGILAKKYLTSFPALFTNLIQKNALRLYVKFKMGSVRGTAPKLVLADFILNCGTIQLRNTATVVRPYKKKIRSIKRRVSKRITKETLRRV